MFIVSNPCEIADELASTGLWKHVHWPQGRRITFFFYNQ
nr:MAG TPA: hypothetical protein [Caudoviricetes sp.]